LDNHYLVNSDESSRLATVAATGRFGQVR